MADVLIAVANTDVHTSMIPWLFSVDARLLTRYLTRTSQTLLQEPDRNKRIFENEYHFGQTDAHFSDLDAGKILRMLTEQTQDVIITMDSVDYCARSDLMKLIEYTNRLATLHSMLDNQIRLNREILDEINHLDDSDLFECFKRRAMLDKLYVGIETVRQIQHSIKEVYHAV